MPSGPKHRLTDEAALTGDYLADILGALVAEADQDVEPPRDRESAEELIADWLMLSWMVKHYERLDELPGMEAVKPPLELLERRMHAGAKTVAPLLGWSDANALQRRAMELLDEVQEIVHEKLDSGAIPSAVADGETEPSVAVTDAQRWFDRARGRTPDNVPTDVMQVTDNDGNLLFVVVPTQEGRYLAIRCNDEREDGVDIELASISPRTVRRLARGEPNVTYVFRPKAIIRTGIGREEFARFIETGDPPEVLRALEALMVVQGTASSEGRKRRKKKKKRKARNS